MARDSVGRWVLAIDFGTSNTSASWRDEVGQIRELRLGSGGNLMPSAVMASPDRLVVGEVATRTAATNPGAFEAAPKRRLHEGAVLLDGRSVAVTTLVAAVYGEVLRRGSRVVGSPPSEVVLTHPDRWGSELQSVLVQAAMEAGISRGRLRLLTEARAAAWFYTGWGRPPEPGERLAVFDFGGGTCDVAVLQKQRDGSFTLLDADGVDGLGGRDLDGRIWQWVRRELAASYSDVSAQLDSPTGLRGRLILMDRIRDAKETLSELAAATIVVPGRDQDAVLTLTRGEFEALIAADIAEAVALARGVFRRTGVPDRLYLTGGSSLTPLVHTELGKIAPVAELGDPQTVVSQGALRAPTNTGDKRSDLLYVPPPELAETVVVSSRAAGPVLTNEPFATAKTVDLATPHVPSAPTRPGPAPRRKRLLVAALVSLVVLAGAGFSIKWGFDHLGDNGTPPGSDTTTSEARDRGERTGGSDQATTTGGSPANCDGFSEHECLILQELSPDFRSKYSCESGASDVVHLELAAATAGVVCGVDNNEAGSWPKLVFAYRAQTDKDVQTIFDSVYEGALKYAPATESWPNPTSVKERKDNGVVVGQAISFYSDDLYALAWTEDAYKEVVVVADNNMSNTKLLEWFQESTIWSE